MSTPIITSTYGRRAREREANLSSIKAKKMLSTSSKRAVDVLKSKSNNQADWITCSESSSSISSHSNSRRNSSDFELEESTPIQSLKMKSNRFDGTNISQTPTRNRKGQATKMLGSPVHGKDRTPLALKRSSSNLGVGVAVGTASKSNKEKDTRDELKKGLERLSLKGEEVQPSTLTVERKKNPEKEQVSIKEKEDNKFRKGKENIDPNHPIPSSSSSSSRSSSVSRPNPRYDSNVLSSSRSNSTVNSRAASPTPIPSQSNRPARRRVNEKQISYREPGEDEIGRRPSPVKKGKEKGKEGRKNLIDGGRERTSEREVERNQQEEKRSKIRDSKQKEEEEESKQEESEELRIEKSHSKMEVRSKVKQQNVLSLSRSNSKNENLKSSSHSSNELKGKDQASSNSRKSSSLTFNQPSSTSLNKTQYQPQDDDSEDELDLIGSSSPPCLVSKPVFKKTSQGPSSSGFKQPGRMTSSSSSTKLKPPIAGSTSQKIKNPILLRTISRVAKSSPLAPLEDLLKTCHPKQTEPLDFEKVLKDLSSLEDDEEKGQGQGKGNFKEIVKIGEASYSEVWIIDENPTSTMMSRYEKGKNERKKKRSDWKVGQSVLKIIPILNPNPESKVRKEKGGVDEGEEEEEKPEESEIKDVIREILLAETLGLGSEGDDEKGLEIGGNGFGGFKG